MVGKSRGKMVCGAGPEPPVASEIPVHCWWGLMKKSLNLSSNAASSVPENTRFSLAMPGEALLSPGLDRAGDDPTGLMEKSSSVRPGPCMPWSQRRREPAEATSLGKES